MAEVKLNQRVQVKEGIYKRQTKNRGIRYEVYIRDSFGRRRFETVEGKLEDAEAFRAKLMVDRHSGAQILGTNKKRFSEVAQMWRKAQQNSNRRDKTLATYFGHLDNHLLPHWGNKKLGEIKPIHVTDLIAELREPNSERGGKPYSDWTIKGVLSTASVIFNYAKSKLEFGGINPVEALEASERPSTQKGRKARILEPEELRKLIEAADGEYGLLFEFAANTGARIGECLGLKWSDIDFQTGMASIERQLDHKLKDAPVKTATGNRSIELTPVLIQNLRVLNIAEGRPSDGYYVFGSRKGSPTSHASARSALKRAAKEAGIPPLRFHDLRHTFISAWISKGATVVDVSRFVGHASPSTTARVYAHEFGKAARSEEIRAKLSSLYSETETETSEVSTGTLTPVGEAV